MLNFNVQSWTNEWRIGKLSGTLENTPIQKFVLQSLYYGSPCKHEQGWYRHMSTVGVLGPQSKVQKSDTRNLTLVSIWEKMEMLFVFRT